MMTRFAIPPATNDNCTRRNHLTEKVEPAILVVAAAIGRKIARDLVAAKPANDNQSEFKDV